MRIVFVLSVLLLQGCTIGYYKTKDNLFGSKSVQSCSAKYTLSVTAEQRQLTTGTQDLPSWAELEKNKYLDSAKKIFEKHGCETEYVENKEDAQLIIEIHMSPYRSALP